MTNTTFSIDSIRNRLKPVFAAYGVDQAVLFGSYANGCATPESDVDIIVDTELRGFGLMELYCAVQDALGGVDLDLFARYELIPGGRADVAIATTGKVIYSAGACPSRYTDSSKNFERCRNIER